jgi:hypothetical protein
VREVTFSWDAATEAANRSDYFARATGEKADESMSKKITYTDGPIGEVEIVKDSLPPPEDLVLKEDTVKITIALSRKSVDFFKEKAAELDTSYQKMIRRLLDSYARAHQYDKVSGTKQDR